MKYFSLKAFAAMAILSGCIDTEGNLEIKGKVVDENTKIAIPNRKITILALNENDETVLSVHAGFFFTDSAGNFAYTLRKLKNAYLYDICIVGDSSYAFSNKRISLFELHRDCKYLTFYASKLTDFAIKIDRKSKMPTLDTLYISWESNGTEGKILYPYTIENYGYGSNNKIEFIGGAIKPVIRTKVYADKSTIIHYKLFRYGKFIGIYDTILCTRGANNTVNFTY
jgi:hypothetical protein